MATYQEYSPLKDWQNNKLISLFGENGEETGIKFQQHHKIHTYNEDGLPRWDEKLMLLEGDVKNHLPFLVDLTEQMDGETQIFEIPEYIVPGTYMVLFYQQLRQSYGYQYSINFETHELETFFTAPPDSNSNRRLELIIWMEDSLLPEGGGDFTLLPASISRLGGVIIGNGILVQPNGTISLDIAYIATNIISTDSGNILKKGTDNKLFVQESDAGGLIDDVLVNGVSVVTDNIAEIDLDAKDVYFEREITNTLQSNNVQDAIDETDADMRYNAIHTVDYTFNDAPTGIVRDRTWILKVNHPLTATAQYSRYFYDNSESAHLDETGNPNISEAVAHVVIDGYHVYIEYLTNGIASSVVDLIDAGNNVLMSEIRPVPSNNIWFFGSLQADIFPEDGSLTSAVDMNVRNIYNQIGNTFYLDTEEKQIVDAINEVNSKVGFVKSVEMPDVITAQEYSQANTGILVYVSKTA